MAKQIPSRIKKSKRLMRHWRKPWTLRARRSWRFRRALSRSGLITPHFSWAEASCKDGTHVPKRLRRGARRHAWNLERFRHAIGNRRLQPISWYRTPSYNRRVGGASQSKHMQAVATDFDRATVERIGRSKWFTTADKIFKRGGVGNYPAGSAHLDSRGYKARWRSF